MKKFRKISLAVVLAVALSLCLAGSASAVTTDVNLGAADSFAILAYSAVTSTGNSEVNGNLGLVPTEAGSGIAGFRGPGVVNGTIYTYTNAGPTDYVWNAGLLDGAKSAQTAAYLDADGRSPWVDLLGTVPAENQLGGRTLPPGVYRVAEGTSANLIGQLILDGTGYPEEQRVWVFQFTSTLVTAADSSVVLVNATPCDVFWQVDSSATIGARTAFVGNIMALASISFEDAATLDGSAHALNGAVTLINDRITKGPCVYRSPTVPYTGGVGSDANTIRWSIALLAAAILAGIFGVSFILRSYRRKKVTS